MKNCKLSIGYMFRFLFSMLLLLGLIACSNLKQSKEKTDVIIENNEMVLIFRGDGKAKSLIHKATGEECLKTGVNLPAFSITQDMPYDNENKLTYPAKPITFYADSIYREGDKLIVSFDRTSYQAVMKLNITDSYIGFNLKEFRYKIRKIGIKRKTRIDRFTFLQLPIKDREHFGEWLNVVWDDKVAVNLLATDPYCKIDAEKRKGYKILQAGGENSVKLENIGAALITTDRSRILDCIDRLEHDYNLPLGVESRRSKEYKNSSYSPRGIVSIENIDDHIAFAKKAGLKQFTIYYPSFAKNTGHFEWRPEYPNGIEDLKKITQKIKNAGMLPGLHIHYNKASVTDKYITPVPDSRLNLRRVFNLRKNIGKNTTEIEVEENPYGCTLEKGRRILKIENELISYEKYTVEPPYKFINCKRGVYNTKPGSYFKGRLFGLLDVDTWPVFVRFNQNTDIQDEVAEQIAKIYDECGFKYIYYDGAEDVNRPYWFNVGKAQLSVYNALKTKQIFAEGAVKSHFSWHILTRGNAFDTFFPEDIKKATRMFPIEEIKLISNDFTSIDFGWNNYVAPGKKMVRMDADFTKKNLPWSTVVVPNETTIGIQPDMLEYVTSRAAAWNSVVCLIGNLDDLKRHPRTDDNLEVIRRWEVARENGFLTEEKKEMLKNAEQEHILLINETGKFELLPYRQLTKENSKVRAFIFNRNNKTWVVYWHISGSGNIELSVNENKVKLYKELGKEIEIKTTSNGIILPVGNRQFLQFDLTEAEVVDLFSTIKLR